MLVVACHVVHVVHELLLARVRHVRMRRLVVHLRRRRAVRITVRMVGGARVAAVALHGGSADVAARWRQRRASGLVVGHAL